MSTLNPLVTIITPAYNHEKFISACIESVLAQTYTNWEQIIVDDGSTDRTAEIIGSYRDPRIKHVRQENQGLEQLAVSYNRGLAESAGELVAILEGDDFWPDYKLEGTVPAFSEPGVVLAYGLVAETAASDNGDSYLPRRTRARHKLDSAILNNDPVGTVVKYMMTAGGVDLIGPSSVVIRRSALEAIGGFQYVPDLCVTDYPTFLSLALCGTFRFVDVVLGFRRRHVGSATYANVDKIVSGARRYADEFVRTHKIEMTENERNGIEASWRKLSHVKEFEQGRVRLVNGQWEKAREHFMKSIRGSDPLVSAAAATGIACSLLHTDLESIFRLLGKADLAVTNEG